MVNQIISAARYNNLQSRVATVLGVGSSNSGYNQTVSSSQVPKSATIQATELNIINLSQDQRTFTWASNGRKLMNEIVT